MYLHAMNIQSLASGSKRANGGPFTRELNLFYQKSQL